MKNKQIYVSVRLYGNDGNYTQCRYGISMEKAGEWAWRDSEYGEDYLCWDTTDSVWFYNKINKFGKVVIVDGAADRDNESNAIIRVPSGELNSSGNIVKLNNMAGEADGSDDCLYWVEGSDGDFYFTDVNANDELQVVLGSKSVSITPKTDSNIGINLSENAEYAEVSINNDSDSGAYCTYTEAQSNEEIVQTGITLQGKESVSFKINNNEIITNGVTDFDIEQKNGSYDDNAELIGETVFSKSAEQINDKSDYSMIIKADTEGSGTDQNSSPEKTEPVSIVNAKVVLSKTSFTYNGKVQKPAINSIGGKTLKSGTDYTAQWSNASSKEAGTYTVTITGKGKYTGKTSATYKITKAANPLKIKAKTATSKYSKLKKKNQTLKVSEVIKVIKKGQGKVTYAKTSGNKKITINKKTGKITVKKGTKKGTYKIKVKVTAAGNNNYKKGSKIVTVKVKIK